VSDSGNKRRVNITIGDHELGLAKASGETVSGYISRLIREDNETSSIRVPIPEQVVGVLAHSGVLDGHRGPYLRAEIANIILRHADDALLDSRQRIKAVLTDLGGDGD
jgi:hypothetical protein